MRIRTRNNIEARLTLTGNLIPIRQASSTDQLKDVKGQLYNNRQLYDRKNSKPIQSPTRTSNPLTRNHTLPPCHNSNAKPMYKCIVSKMSCPCRIQSYRIQCSVHIAYIAMSSWINSCSPKHSFETLLPTRSQSPIQDYVGCNIM